METGKPPLTRGIKVSYGVGQAAEGIKNAAFNVFVFFYYTQVLGLPTVYTGIAIGIALAVDSITDPLIGSLSDNWQGKHGRRHPFIYASILPLGLAFVGLFNPPELGEFSLFLWLTVFSVATRAMMTLYYVPHVSLGAELTDDFNERTEVVAFRYFFSYVGWHPHLRHWVLVLLPGYAIRCRSLWPLRYHAVVVDDGIGAPDRPWVLEVVSLTCRQAV
jgi:Na+/melibiose symporter-like transporter